MIGRSYRPQVSTVSIVIGCLLTNSLYGYPSTVLGLGVQPNPGGKTYALNYDAAGNANQIRFCDPCVYAQRYGQASSKLPAPAKVVKPKPMPKLLDRCTVLVKGTIYTIVPTTSILFHGRRTSIELEEGVPGNKKFVECKEFLRAYPNDVLVIKGTSTGIGRVSVTNSFARDEVKVVIAVDEKGVPACTVDFK
jgi:hypothetical protein